MNNISGISSRITEVEEWISDLEDRMVKIIATKQNIEKRMKRNEDSLRDLWDNIKHTNICIIGVPEGEEREKGPEKIFEEIISELSLGFLCGSTDKESACIAGDLGLILALGRSPVKGKGYPLQYSDLENSMDYGVPKSWTQLTFTFTWLLTKQNNSNTSSFILNLLTNKKP